MENGLLTKLNANSVLTRTADNAVAVVKRVPLSWWQGLLVLLLLLVLAGSAAKLFWALWPTQEQKTVQATLSIQPDAGTVEAAGVDVSRLLALNIYGVAGEVVVEQPVDMVLPNEDIEAEDTKLALKLTGVLNSSDPLQARAMIAHSNKQASYKVGDKLPAGRNVTLDRVLDRRVILNNAGRYESLWLFEGLNGEGLLVETPAVQKADHSSLPATGNTVASQPAAGRNVIAELPTPETLAQVVRVTPHKKGFAVKPLKNLAQFEQLGFKSGDVVTAVNGTPVSLDPEQMRQIYLEVLQSPTAQMQVLRGDRQLTLDIDLANLTSAINN